MLGPDAVEKAQYLPTGPVKPTQQSDRDRKQKFAEALKEKLEDEQGRKRKESPEDELVLATEPQDEFEGDTDSGEEQQAESESPPASEEEQAGETESREEAPDDPDESGHIDVKA